MRIEQFTRQTICQVERFQSSFNAARFGALRDLPQNPYQAEVRWFGNALAVKNKSPELRGKQRVTGLRASDATHLDDLLDWYRRDQLRCSILVDYGETDATLFRRLAAAGLVSSGSGSTIAWMDEGEPRQPLVEVVVRESPASERELYLDLFQQCFCDRGEAKPAYRPIQWAEDALPAGKRYIAEVGGQLVGFASMPIIDGVAICGTAGTLPKFRGRGVQRCLIERRIADADRLGCSMLLGGAELGSTPHRNFVRCGFRMMPLGMGWTDPVASC